MVGGVAEMGDGVAATAGGTEETGNVVGVGAAVAVAAGAVGTGAGAGAGLGGGVVAVADRKRIPF